VTIETTIAESAFKWTGVETSFPAGFPAMRVEDVIVQLDGLTLTRGLHYTVALAAGSRLVTVTPATMPSSSGFLRIYRSSEFTQSDVFAEGEAIPAPTHEDQHDRHVMRLQELRRDTDKAIAMAASSAVPRGAWSPDATYAAGDMVNFLGSSYRALVANSGVEPGADAQTWFQVAAKGEPGAPGLQGPPGVPGAGGFVTVDFGPYPGGDSATAVVADAGVAANSAIEANIIGVATADHSADEHIAERLEVAVAAIVPGVGFTIVVQPRGLWPFAAGAYTVSWLRR
jgi:hypothetical protein